MKYDLSQPISQRGIGEKDAENQRIAEIADELIGCIKLPTLFHLQEK